MLTNIDMYSDWRHDAEIALWDRQLVELLVQRRRAVERWACSAASSTVPVSVDDLGERLLRLGVELGTAGLDVDFACGLARLLADDALTAVAECLLRGRDVGDRVAAS